MPYSLLLGCFSYSSVVVNCCRDGRKLVISLDNFFFALQATALDVQKLLVSGRKKEALECAQLGQLWGPALALASELGDQVITAIYDLSLRVLSVMIGMIVSIMFPRACIVELNFQLDFHFQCLQFFGDTVKQMALNQLAAGSPLRTLFLLIARKPADVFANSSTPNNISSAFNIQPQPVQVICQFGYCLCYAYAILHFLCTCLCVSVCLCVVV